MSINSDFVENLKKYIILENKINEINKLIKTKKNEKNTIESSILEYAKKKNIDKNKFNLNNNVITFYKQIHSPSISLKLLKLVLEETIQNKDIIELIINNISKKRESLSKYNYSIKLKKIKL